MNAAAEAIAPSPPDPLATYRLAFAARTQAAKDMQKTMLALTRGQQLRAGTQQRLQEASAAADRDANEQAQAIQSMISSGVDVIGAPDAADERIALDLLRARHAADIGEKALAGLEASAAKARTALAGAEREVVAAIAALRAAEISSAEQECTSLLHQFMQCFAEIHVRNDQFGNDVFDTDIQHRRLKGVFDACLHTAGGEWNARADQRGENAPILREARERLLQRDARLIAGGTDELTEG